MRLSPMSTRSHRTETAQPKAARYAALRVLRMKIHAGCFITITAEQRRWPDGQMTRPDGFASTWKADCSGSCSHPHRRPHPHRRQHLQRCRQGRRGRRRHQRHRRHRQRHRRSCHRRPRCAQKCAFGAQMETATTAAPELISRVARWAPTARTAALARSRARTILIQVE